MRGWRLRTVFWNYRLSGSLSDKLPGTYDLGLEQVAGRLKDKAKSRFPTAKDPSGPNNDWTVDQ